MTYKECYEKCKTLQELKKEVQNDISVAIIIGNLDRVKIIKQTAEEVANRKFKGADNIE
jgi:hypothetical protein